MAFIFVNFKLLFLIFLFIFNYFCLIIWAKKNSLYLKNLNSGNCNNEANLSKFHALLPYDRIKSLQGYYLKNNNFDTNNEHTSTSNLNGYYFGKTFIKGCKRIKLNVFQNLLNYKEFELFDKTKLDSSIKKIKLLNIFKKVDVKVVPYKCFNNIIIYCKEDDYFKTRVRGSFACTTKAFTCLPSMTYNLGLSLLCKNPTGYADIISLNIDLTRFSKFIGFLYEFPYFLNFPIGSELKLFKSEIITPLISGSNDFIYSENREGFDYCLNYFDFPLQANIFLSFHFIKIKSFIENISKVIKLNPDFFNYLRPYLFCESSFLFNVVDNQFLPKKGTYFFLQTKIAIPFDNKPGFFAKFLFEYTKYFSFCSNIFCSLRFKAGHIFTKFFDSILPNERFYLGGPCTIRSYEPQMVPPICFFHHDNKVFWVALGAKSLILFNWNLHFELFKNAGLSLFNDIGLLLLDLFNDLSFKNIVEATGFGLWYLTSLALLKFDLGFKWKRRNNVDKWYAWYFTIGQEF